MEDEETEIEDFISFIEGSFDTSQAFNPENPSVPLANATYGSEEIGEAFESIFSTFLTKGEKVENFESKWSNYIGKKEGVMVNSGSSANLMALKAIEEEFDDSSEIIVPSFGWSTTIFPIIDAGATPVIVDVDPESFRMDPDQVKSTINDHTEAVIAVHLLGNPAPIEELRNICDENSLYLIEDCAQAHGASYNGESLGSFGNFSTFSFSFSHHITTAGEGGMVLTDSTKNKEKMRMMRSWGRVRGTESSQEFYEKHDLDPLFASHGYNLRPTEIQASFGIHQVDRIEKIVRERRAHAEYLDERLSDIDGIKLLDEDEEATCSYLHYPVILDQNSGYSRDKLRDFLENRGIETRTIFSGDPTKHPGFKEDECRIEGDLKGSKRLRRDALYVSCHSYLTEAHLDHIVKAFREFFK